LCTTAEGIVIIALESAALARESGNTGLPVSPCIVNLGMTNNRLSRTYRKGNGNKSQQESRMNTSSGTAVKKSVDVAWKKTKTKMKKGGEAPPKVKQRLPSSLLSQSNLSSPASPTSPTSLTPRPNSVAPSGPPGEYSGTWLRHRLSLMSQQAREASGLS
jgi:hypothetical protein